MTSPKELRKRLHAWVGNTAQPRTQTYYLVADALAEIERLQPESAEDTNDKYRVALLDLQSKDLEMQALSQEVGRLGRQVLNQAERIQDQEARICALVFSVNEYAEHTDQASDALIQEVLKGSGLERAVTDFLEAPGTGGPADTLLRHHANRLLGPALEAYRKRP